MGKRLLELAAEIVQAQTSRSKMSGGDIEYTLVKVYNALHRMRQAEDEGRQISFAEFSPEPPAAAGPPPAVDSRSSIQEDKVVCLECRAEFRQLTANHLRSHELTPREYKKKWGFPQKQALAAKVLSKLRSRSAKKRGLPAKLQEYLDSKRKK
jgi:predicted transcriptional regulator